MIHLFVKRYFVCLSAAVFLISGSANAQYDSVTAGGSNKPLEILRITPAGDNVSSGEVSSYHSGYNDGRQIVITFNQPVVAIGDMARDGNDIPVSISPSLDCQWRWLNTTSLACQLANDDAFKPATSYNIAVKKNAVFADDGKKLTQSYQHNFVTIRPKISYIGFIKWHSPTKPEFYARFNQDVTEESAKKAFYFEYRDDKQKLQQIDALVAKENDSWRITSQEGDLPSNRDITIIGNNAVLESVHGKQQYRQGKENLYRRDFATFGDFEFLGIECYDNDGKEVFIGYSSDANDVNENNLLKQKCGVGSNSGSYWRGNKVRLVFSAPIDGNTIIDNVRVEMRANLQQQESWQKWAQYRSNNLNIWQDFPIDNNDKILHKKAKRYYASLPHRFLPSSEYDIAFNYQKNVAPALNKLFDIFLNKVLLEDVFPDSYLDNNEDDKDINNNAKIKDIFGRELVSKVDIAFASDRLRPDFKLRYDNAVLEKNFDTEVPAYITNIKELDVTYRTISKNGVSEWQERKITGLDDIIDKKYSMPMALRDMLGGQSGAVYAKIASTPKMTRYPYYEDIFAIISPYHVHAKIGHFNGLVWLTDLQSGDLVADAEIVIYRDPGRYYGSNNFNHGQFDKLKELSRSETDRNGIAVLAGMEKHGNRYNDNLVIKITHGDECVYLPLIYDFELNSYRISNETVYSVNRDSYGHMRSWGFTAQGVYRVGDLLEYKIYLRDQENNQLLLPEFMGKQDDSEEGGNNNGKENGFAGYKLRIIDPKGKAVYEQDGLSLSEFGTIAGDFKLAENAAVGWYKFELSAKYPIDGSSKGEKELSWQPMQVLVSDFTPASFKVTNEIAGKIFAPEDEMLVTSNAKLHSGGAYNNADMRLTVTLKRQYFRSSHPLASGFEFESSYPYGSDSEIIFQQKITMPENAEHEQSIILPKLDNILYGKIMAETAVMDERGKYVANNSSAKYVAVNRLVGLKNTKWLYDSGKPAEIRYVVVDASGKPVNDSRVDLVIERKITKAARVKGAGNSYNTEYHRDWQEVAKCDNGKEIRQDANGAEAGNKDLEPAGQYSCIFTPQKAGDYRVRASVSDDNGRKHQSDLRLWVSGNDDYLWDNDNEHYLQVIPEQTSYKIGERAKYLVKNPFSNNMAGAGKAKALVTIERYGVLKSWVQDLEGATPVIEFDVTEEYQPGFYLSVLAFSPRVPEPVDRLAISVGARPDLAKPAFKIGYIKVPVIDDSKQINVNVKTDRAVYKPREQVTIELQAGSIGNVDNKKHEIALVVIDEAVLDLVKGGKSYYNPYKGMYHLDNLDVSNYNLLKKLIGQQNFDKKGANAGGDGAGQSADISIRDIMEYTAYWNPAVMTDDNGNAEISFELPDNLTGWRVLAIAADKQNKFGLGEARFVTNKPTEIRPVMPNQILEQDKFSAGFSIMNRTEQIRELVVDIKLSGNVELGQESEASKIQKKITLKPYERSVVTIPVSSTIVKQQRDKDAGEIEFMVTAGDDIDRDGLVHKLLVMKRRGLESAANYGTTMQNKVIEQIEIPRDIYPDSGDITVSLSPSIIANIDGAFRYLRDYPYSCWEQRLSKAVAAAHYNHLQGYLQDEISWPESKELPQQILDIAASNQAPNGGMAYYVASNGYSSPYLSAYTALAFNWMREMGYNPPVAVEDRLHDYLLNYLKNSDAAPEFYSAGMASTVRAVALAALAPHGKIEHDDLERFRQYLPNMSLFGKAHYLQAALQLRREDSEVSKIAIQQAMQQILSAANQTGGKVIFNEQYQSLHSRILSSSLRSNCAVLSAMLAYEDFAQMGDKQNIVGDIPFKLLRYVSDSRGSRTHWENTQENLFCMQAIIDYAASYEAIKPAMNVAVSVDDKQIGDAEFDDLTNPAESFIYPISDDDIIGEGVSRKKVVLDKQGDGRLYYSTRLSYAPKMSIAQQVNAGMDIRREYHVKQEDGSWQLWQQEDKLKRGDLVRVDIYLSLPAARNFVVVDDAVPGGLEPVNQDLATSSVIDANAAKMQYGGGSWYLQLDNWRQYNYSRWSFYHKELRHDSVRFYSDYLDAGNYHLSYIAQVIADGEFGVMPVYAVEMYDTDIYGKGLPRVMKVGN